MARLKSPKYPNFPLTKAIDLSRQIYEADRTSSLPREVIAKHLGYSGISGASDATIATIVQYGLLERHGKGEMRVSPNAVDIFFPETEAQKTKAINRAALSPPLFSELYTHFENDLPSDIALETYLHRNEFHPKAIKLIMKSFPETMRMLKQSKDSESDSNLESNEPESDSSKDVRSFGEAKVGDLIQWEVDGIIRFEEPKKVVFIDENSEWVWVEGSNTGVPMNQVVVKDKLADEIKPPIMDIEKILQQGSNVSLMRSEVLTSGKLKDGSFEVRVTGNPNAKDIGRIITMLEAQRTILQMDDEDTES